MSYFFLYSYYNGLDGLACNFIDFGEGYMMLFGDALAVLIFRGRADHTRTQVFDFYQHWSELGGDLLLRALGFEPLHLLYTHAQCTRLA